MKLFSVRLAATFLLDLTDITLYILGKTCSSDISRRFYQDVLSAINDRAFGADSYESYHPYPGSPEYRRLYFGHYTIFYVIDGIYMDVRRILWSGADDSNKL